MQHLQGERDYAGNEGMKRSAKKENAEYLTMGETLRCYSWKKEDYEKVKRVRREMR